MLPKKKKKGGQLQDQLHSKQDDKDDELQIPKKQVVVTEMDSTSKKDSNSSMTSCWYSNNIMSTIDHDRCIGKTVDVMKHAKNKLMHTNVQTPPCVYEDDQPLEELKAMEMTILKTKVTLDIYPTCRFVAHSSHIHSHTCHILKQMGYSGDANAKERSKHWTVTQKMIMSRITFLRNKTLDRYRTLAKGNFLHFLSWCLYAFVSHIIVALVFLALVTFVTNDSNYT